MKTYLLHNPSPIGTPAKQGGAFSPRSAVAVDDTVGLEIVMGRRRQRDLQSQTLSPSPCHSLSSSSSSSDFEFTISISPRKSTTALCPADELFYKGQLLPLHLSPRISMVRTLLLSSSSSSSSSTDTTHTNSVSRDSTGSRSSNDSQSSVNSDLVSLYPDCDSSRPSSVTEEDEFKRLHNTAPSAQTGRFQYPSKKNKYFSLSRFSSVFLKEPGKNRDREHISGSGSSVKRVSATAKEVIIKYLKKVKPLYEKLSQQKQHQQKRNSDGGFTGQSHVSSLLKTQKSLGVQSDSSGSGTTTRKESVSSGFSHSFSGNLRYPRRRSCISSCPSSTRSSPSHSGLLSRSGFPGRGRMGDTSSMEELQSAIQGAIAHCKNSLVQNKTAVSDEI